MYLLYGGRYTRAILVEMVLAEGGLDYELREIDILAEEHRAPAFLAINPAGRVPVLVTPEGDRLAETAAINLYLAERHGLSQIAPQAGEPERGPFLSGLFFITSEFEPLMKRYFFPHRIALRDEDAAEVQARALAAARDRLAVVEQRLSAGGPHYLGDRFSLIDMTLTYWITCLTEDAPTDALPALEDCARRVRARPRLRPKFEELEAWIQEYQALVARGGGVR